MPSKRFARHSRRTHVGQDPAGNPRKLWPVGTWGRPGEAPCPDSPSWQWPPSALPTGCVARPCAARTGDGPEPVARLRRFRGVGSSGTSSAIVVVSTSAPSTVTAPRQTRAPNGTERPLVPADRARRPPPRACERLRAGPLGVVGGGVSNPHATRVIPILIARRNRRRRRLEEGPRPARRGPSSRLAKSRGRRRPSRHR